VHLDVRPLAVPFDATTGFWLQGSRVVLSPPVSSAGGSTKAVPPPGAVPQPWTAPPPLGREAGHRMGEAVALAAVQEDAGDEEAVPLGGRGRFRHAALGGDPGDNVEARWNVDATTAAGSSVDIVVHMHGYGSPGSDFLSLKAAKAGL